MEPIFSVDIVAVDGRKRFLLMRRESTPVKDVWGFLSGKIQKDEKTHDAAMRMLKEETGLSGSFVRQIGFYEMIDKDLYFDGIQGHTPVIVSLVNVETPESVEFSDESAAFKWFDTIEDHLPPHVQVMLARAGF